MEKGRCARDPTCEFWNEGMLLEAQERERDRQLPQWPQDLRTPPVRPAQVPQSAKGIHQIFTGILNRGQCFY
jgi:hypothetical protein